MADLICKNISKRFGSVTALKSINLSVKKGEVRGLLGGNGSGKSTLAKILGGSVKLSAGELKVFGKEDFIKSPSHAKKKKIIITSQELSLFDNLSVEKNLLICNVPRQLSMFTNYKELKSKSYSILKKMNVDELINKNTKDLSANEKYIIEFAKALIQEPEILIIDEITSALYRDEVQLIKEMITYLRENGCVVIFISHRMEEIFSICDTITVMRSGESIGTYDVHEKTENELLALVTGEKIEEIEKDSIPKVKSGESILSFKDLKLPNFGTELSEQIKPGEIICVSGLKGHGQSDLVRTLFGLQNKITLQIEGKKKNIANPEEAIQSQIAFISGDREKEGVFPSRSVSENLSAVVNLVKKKKIDKESLIKEYGVVLNSLEQPINSLSGGNQQKIVIGRWTATQPKILLADDPTKGIDAKARKDVHNAFYKLTNKGSSIIVVSSDDEEIVDLAKEAEFSRVFVMYEGNIVQTLTKTEITKDNIIAASMPNKGVV